eukprot:scaffold131690_cov53-Attheya_sp.AAC.1
MLPKEKSLGKLTQRFVQLFLLGHDVISLSDTSTKILGCPSINIKKSKGAGSSGMKTKVRRLYDIANLMCIIGLVSKAVNNVSQEVPLPLPVAAVVPTTHPPLASEAADTIIIFLWIRVDSSIIHRASSNEQRWRIFWRERGYHNCKIAA